MSESLTVWRLMSPVMLLSGILLGKLMFTDDVDSTVTISYEEQETQSQTATLSTEQSLELTQIKTNNKLVQDDESQLSQEKISKLKEQLVKTEQQSNYLKQQLQQLQQDNLQLQLQLQNIQTYSMQESSDSDNYLADQSSEYVGQDQPAKVMSKQQLNALLPPEYHQFYSKQYGSMVDKLNQFQQELRDEDWGMLMEQQIMDFIGMHEFSDQIEATVACRSKHCIVHGKEYQDNIWQLIYRDMTQQSWWLFTSSSSAANSSSTANDGPNILFVVMLAVS